MKRTLSLIVLAALAACSRQPQKPAGAMPPPEVLVETVKPATVVLSTELPGRVQARRTAQVRARVEGIIERRLFPEGAEVKEGEVLYAIDSATLKAALDSARASLARAQADLEQARLKLNRYETLKDSKVVSQQDFDEAVARAKQAEADVALQRANVRQAEIKLQYATVRAPIAGRIGRSLVTEGALVGKNNEGTHLATIEQINPVYVNFTQSAADMRRLQEALKATSGQGAAPVTVLMDDGREYPAKGRLLFSEMTVDPTTGEVLLRAEVPNAERTLLPGMFVRVRAEQGVYPQAITVPQRALMRTQQGASVLVVGADGKVAPRPVVTSLAQGDRWIVTQGLHAGDKVIVEGLQKVKPGAPAKAVEATQTQP